MISNEINELLRRLPGDVAADIIELHDQEEYSCDNLLEIEFDYGRLIRLHYRDKSFHYPSIVKELDYEVSDRDIQSFLADLHSHKRDFRTGVPKTLHRVSILPNRAGQPVGLTIRVGQEFEDAAWGIEDLLAEDKSILIIGNPGKGKTTMLRASAKYSSDILNRRVIIVDPSDEICGIYDLPHESVGRSRKLAIPPDYTMYEMLIQAVENHTPETVLIDEISDETEVKAVKSVAKRGIRMLATVHGSTLQDLIDNPVLNQLLGGIKVVTISDEEAFSRQGKKSIPERQYTSSFDAVVVLINHNEIEVYHDASNVLDEILRGNVINPEVRRRDKDTFKVVKDQSVKLASDKRSRK